MCVCDAPPSVNSKPALTIKNPNFTFLERLLLCHKLICVIVSGRIKGAARVINVMYPCGFICIPVVLTLRRMNLIKIKNNYNGTGSLVHDKEV